MLESITALKQKLGWTSKRKAKKQLFIRTYKLHPKDRNTCIVYEYGKPVSLIKYEIFTKEETIMMQARWLVILSLDLVSTIWRNISSWLCYYMWIINIMIMNNVCFAQNITGPMLTLVTGGFAPVTDPRRPRTCPGIVITIPKIICANWIWK